MHRRVDPRTRAVIGVSVAALVVHLVPLFLPREDPSVEIALAQLLPDAEARIPLLAPLRRNARSRGGDLREAAELVLPASTQEARAFLVEAARRDPTSVENDLLEARICRIDGDERCLQLALAKARRHAPGDPRPEVLDADFRGARGDVPGARLALERALEKAPEDVELRRRLAHALVEGGQEIAADAALAPLEKALPAHRFLVERALLRLANGRDRAARAILEDAVNEPGAGAEAHYYLGVALFRLREAAAAATQLRRADRLDPTDFRSLALLCALQRQTGQVDDATASRLSLERRFSARRSEYDDACPP